MVPVLGKSLYPWLATRLPVTLTLRRGAGIRWGVVSDHSERLQILLFPFFPLSAVLDNERLTAEEMDERRRQNVAYEYLCHLEEAKR